MIDENIMLMELENLSAFKTRYIIECTKDELQRWIKGQPKIEKCGDCSRREIWWQGYKDGLNANKWIPCSERLPEEDGGLYWTTHEDGSVILHGYMKKHGFIYNWEVDDLEKRKRQGGVIAWMLIKEPEPYKGVD